MSKEFIWGASVEGQRTEFKVVVEDGVCMTYEDGVLTNRMSYTVPADSKAMWIDEVIEVWGKRCRFQLDKGVPYLQMDGKWTASDTTMDERMAKMAESQRVTALVQALLGLLLCVFCAVLYFVRSGDMGRWWFTAIIGSFMLIMGLLQYNAAKKGYNE